LLKQQQQQHLNISAVFYVATSQYCQSLQ